jgi:Glyoxalase-like domain
VDLTWEQIVIDARDPVTLGRWWAEALGWVVVGDAADEFEIRPTPEQMPGLLFVPVPEGKTGKNRIHPDFRPIDQDIEVDRLLSLGAQRVDVGQGDASWVVLADPEGNEFCILRGAARPDSSGPDA